MIVEYSIAAFFFGLAAFSFVAAYALLRLTRRS